MNIIINDFDDPELSEVTFKILRDFKAQHCAAIYNNVPTKVPKHVKCDRFDWEKIIFFADYDVNWNNITPLDEEIIESYSQTETVVIKMMDRLEVRRPLSYQMRKEMYLKHLRFWLDYIKKNHIDLFFSTNTPHEIYDFVIYDICKKQGIPTLFTHQSQIDDTSLLLNDWQKSIDNLPLIMSQLKGKPIKLSERFERIFSYYSHSNPTPGSKITLSYTNQRFTIHKIIQPIQVIIKLLTTLKRTIKRLPIYLVVYTRREIIGISTAYLHWFYRQHTTKADLKQKYIYFPLHYQPELTTSPGAGEFVNQVLIATLLSHYAPKNVLIYIKEHPAQNARCRSTSYFRELLNMPNVRLMPVKTSTYELIDHAQAVATGMGTAGWEGIFRGKPVLMFGHDFYQYAPGVFPIKTNADCAKAMTQIFTGQYKYDENNLRIFLKAVEMTTISGTTDLLYRQQFGVNEAQNSQNIYGAIAKRLTDMGFAKNDR
ncbi:MAG: hypothetical protein WC773_03285 [Patescibacteria group bacterium]|jgi:hypothetical protein